MIPLFETILATKGISFEAAAVFGYISQARQPVTLAELRQALPQLSRQSAALSVRRLIDLGLVVDKAGAFELSDRGMELVKTG